MTAQDHFMSIAMMIDDLRAHEREPRVTAMKALLTISQTLGPERTRTELIPYITDYLDDDDEVLKAMASALGVMLPDVGGIPHVGVLLGPLELLASLDEVTVRDEAVSSLSLLAGSLFPEAAAAVSEQGQLFLQIIHRLAGNQDSPHSRCSACGIIAAPYKNAPAATKKELKSIFGRLCDDDEAMVRRAACVALGQSMAKALEGSVIEFLGNFSKFCKDANDSVRLQAIPAAVAICPYLTDTGLAQVIGLVRSLCADAGWRVRFMMADKLGAICRAWPQKDVMKVGLTMFKSLLKDQSPEIRASAVFNLDVLVSVLPPEAHKEAVDEACKLHSDTNSHVRNAVAATLLKAAKDLPRELWASAVVPTCKALLTDSDAQVRLGLVTGFASIAGGGKEDKAPASAGAADAVSQVATALVPVVASLAKDPSWRVREAVVGQLPSIIKGSGPAEKGRPAAAASAELVDVVVSSLSDRVATIRNRAAQSCFRLVEKLGCAWAQELLFPRIFALASSKLYQQRVALLHAVGAIIDAADAAVVKSDLMPVVARLCADPVANVRIAAAKVVRGVQAARKVPAGDVDGLLAKLRADPDVDVRDAAAPPKK